MKILWLTNAPLPEANELMNERPNPFGGWLINASKNLSEQDNLDLSILSPKSGTSGIKVMQGKKIKHYLFPPINNKEITSIENKSYFNKILEETEPDIVHIFGTEYAHTLAMVNICKDKNINTVINIQGLVSIYSQHYMACIPEKVQRKFTFRDFIKRDSLRQQQMKFAKRGEFEIEAIRKVKHVIGRTTWDRACTTQINSDVHYHFCNETLRDEFYKHTWDINKCEKFSIFVSQASYPIKGLHFLLESMPLILKRFPNTKLYISGPDITRSDTLKEKLNKTFYTKYIIELIQTFNLKDKVIFTGLLDEKQMCERYLKTNVFVSPSIIENESNSLSEAKILGVPCVASYVGGVTDRINDKEDGFFYQADAPYMLSYYVCEIFGNEELSLKLTKNAREHALKTHDLKENMKRLIDIYNEIIEDSFNEYIK